MYKHYKLCSFVNLIGVVTVVKICFGRGPNKYRIHNSLDQHAL